MEALLQQLGDRESQLEDSVKQVRDTWLVGCLCAAVLPFAARRATAELGGGTLGTPS